MLYQKVKDMAPHDKDMNYDKIIHYNIPCLTTVFLTFLFSHLSEVFNRKWKTVVLCHISKTAIYQISPNWPHLNKVCPSNIM